MLSNFLDPWTHLFVSCFSANKLNVGLSVGQHFYSGVRRHVSRNPPWPLVCFPLHCIWNHPEWHAHLHPLQQILRLLQQAEGLRVHCSQERKGEGGLHTESHEENIWMLWRRYPPAFVTALIHLMLWILGGKRQSEEERIKNRSARLAKYKLTRLKATKVDSKISFKGRKKAQVTTADFVLSVLLSCFPVAVLLFGFFPVFLLLLFSSLLVLLVVVCLVFFPLFSFECGVFFVVCLFW